LRISEDRPFFAEIPYYVWGEVNYDSEGDCQTPVDRTWTCLELTHRDAYEQIEISSSGDEWTVAGADPGAARVAHFLSTRCNGSAVSPLSDVAAQGWDERAALQRPARVRAVFESPELAPFACGHFFWGSWKWIGWYATEYTWVGRWIMESVLSRDPRGVNLAAYWLQQGTVGEDQSAALRYALGHLTKLDFASDAEWAAWYFNGPGQALYPEPNFEAWHRELKEKYADLVIPSG
jgi:hypothetical protein